MKLRVPSSLVLVAGLLAWCLAAEAGAPQHPKIHILSDQALPPALMKAVDIRWASDKSVYLAMIKEGTVEASLQPLGKVLKELVPASRKPGGFFGCSRIGVSADFLAVSSPFFSVTWRDLDRPERKEEGGFDFIEDLDVYRNQALILGARRDEAGNFAPDGGIVWLGSLDKDLKDLRPILFDSTGPGAHNLAKCGTLELGAVRFLPGGSMVAVPGVQAGAHLFDPTGKLVQSWDTMGLGLAADCPKLSQQEARRINLPPSRAAWLNGRTTLDDILPLPEGPGLVLRSVEGGRVRWHLKVLALKGEWRTFELPIEPQNEIAHLRGDVRAGRIALLVYAWKPGFMGSLIPRLALAEVPRLAATGAVTRPKGEENATL
jgi:hypothetical protein